MYLGIDLGTSEVKVALVDEAEHEVAHAAVKLALSMPRPRWSEQRPEDWWQATCEAMAQVREAAPRALAAVEAIGLSGQMHGAVLLDAADRVLRPAMLWNDGRADAEVAQLQRREAEVRRLTGNQPIVGFTAPKLMWVRRHEPDCFSRLACVLLPKDYLGLMLTGERASEVSDASGTLWLDVSRRDWSEDMLAACGLARGQMPALLEGNMPRGRLRAELAREWGMSGRPVVAAGGGDNPAAAIGAGVIDDGDALLSLGTSGVIVAASRRFQPGAGRAVQVGAHALPERWCHLTVTMAATSCLTWAGRLTGCADSELAELAAAVRPEDAPLFLPYLSGVRTPHNDPHAQGVFFGLTAATDRAALAYAVLEGVAFSLADGHRALAEGGEHIERAIFVGGGSRSLAWGRLIAAASGMTLLRPAGANLGGALGAARLARMALTGEPAATVCRKPPAGDTIAPDPQLTERLAARLARYRRLDAVLREEFPSPTPTQGS